MRQIIFTFIIILVFSGIITVVLKNPIPHNSKSSEQTAIQVPQGTNDIHPDAYNETYTFGDHPVTLVNGQAHVSDEILGIDSIYHIYKKPIFGDIGNDGYADAAVIITVASGGTGTFFYGFVISNESGDFHTSNGIYLGDRILPEFITIQGTEISFTFLDRAESESMVDAPTYERTVKVHYDTELHKITEF